VHLTHTRSLFKSIHDHVEGLLIPPQPNRNYSDHPSSVPTKQLKNCQIDFLMYLDQEDFRDIQYLSVLTTIAESLQFWLKLNKNRGHFILRTHVLLHVSQLAKYLLEWKMFQRKNLWRDQTHFKNSFYVILTFSRLNRSSSGLFYDTVLVFIHSFINPVDQDTLICMSFS
jgi:hypothetical protein